MEAAVLNATAESPRGDGARSEQRLLELSNPAYRLAFRVLGSHEAAEDAVQQAYLNALRYLDRGGRPEQERTWFLKVVANAARDSRRSETSRRRGEAAVEARQDAGPGPDRELINGLRVALHALEEKYRLPVSLCYEEKLSQREVAAVLDIPERTVSKYVNTGLGKLRRALEGAGYPAAVAIVLGGLKQTAPAVPASLAGRVEALVANGARTAPQELASRAARKGSVAKGGLAMKVIAGIVLAGAIAAGVAVVSGGDGGSRLPAEKPKNKFSTPVTASDAEWHLDGVWAGCGVKGYLDGPRKEIFVFTGPSTKMWFEWAGDFNLRKYEKEIDRYLTVTGGARGWLDGPFTRARFGGWSYGSSGVRTAGSPDGRYLYMVDLGRLRVLDMEKRTVRTLLDKVNAVAVSVDKKGNAWIFSWGGGLRIVNVEGKVLETRSLPGNFEKQPLIGHGFCARLDEENDRLWGMKRNGLYLWYWDFKQAGKVVPVLWDYGKKSRGKCVTGPFEGTQMHCPAGFAFGPDDPDKLFGYVGGGDDTTFYRLDFKKKEWVMFGPPKEHEKKPFKVFRFVHHKGKFPCNSIVSWCGTPGWDEEGNIYLGVALGARTIRYKRVK